MGSRPRNHHSTTCATPSVFILGNRDRPPLPSACDRRTCRRNLGPFLQRLPLSFVPEKAQRRVAPRATTLGCLSSCRNWDLRFNFNWTKYTEWVALDCACFWLGHVCWGNSDNNDGHQRIYVRLFPQTCSTSVEHHQLLADNRFVFIFRSLFRIIKLMSHFTDRGLLRCILPAQMGRLERRRHCFRLPG